MMNNDIIDIRDKFLIDDDHSNIRGFVAAYNDAGERVFLKENMIVINGRKMILNFLRSPGNENFFSNLSAFLDTSTNVTTPEMTFTSIRGCLGGLALDSIYSLQTAMKRENMTRDLVQFEGTSSDKEEEKYSKIFKAGDYFIIENFENTTVLSPAPENQIRSENKYYYERITLTAQSDLPENGIYFTHDSVSGKDKRTTTPLSDIEGNKTVYMATMSTANYNPDKEYYYKNGSDFVKSTDNYLSTDKDYYVKNIKSDINFELVECFKITYEASKSNRNGQLRFGSLGLYLPDSGDPSDLSNATLFSRVTFPPYSARSNLTFFYYLYF